jgi:thiol:disulfide interchange protein DsbC
MFQQSLVRALAGAALLAAATACADEASVKKAFSAKFPKANVESVKLLPETGLYEIVIPRGDDPIIIYTDADFRFMLQGNLVETKGMTDLTEKTRSRATAIDFSTLPLDKAIKKVKGNGSRKVAVFTDPDCPFCKRVEQEFEKLDNVTVYLIMYPIEQLHPKAAAKAKSIWCSPDRLKAWDDYMLRGTSPTASGDCANPVDELMAWGQKKGINATPTLVFADGSRVPGALTAAQLESRFAEAGGK